METRAGVPLLFFAPVLLTLLLITLMVWQAQPTKMPTDYRPSFSGSSAKPFDWIVMCLGQDWGGRLPLGRVVPPAGEMGNARFINRARHYLIDVRDTGASRVLRAYSRDGRALTMREREAVEGCLTGAAWQLASPQL